MAEDSGHPAPPTMFPFSERPAHAGIDTAASSLLRTSHAGLWSDKYGPSREPGKGWPGERTKGAWMNMLTRYSHGAEKHIEQASMALQRLVNARRGTIVRFKTIEPLLVGIGLPHPTENGLLWHHTIGAPFVPGSSLKGMTRNWAAEWLELGQQHADVARIFGMDQELMRRSPSLASAGSVCFLDAIPAKPIQLEVEAMTPHNQPYYGETGLSRPTHWPGDWFDPVPIGYLTVAADSAFTMALLPRLARAPDEDDVATAAEWLAHAAEFIGTGAKTARGMGRMAVLPASKS